jgi:hypothetical protein
MSDKPTSLPVRFDTIPADLQVHARWVLWKYVHRRKPSGGWVWAKLPVQIGGAAASTTDSTTWTTFDDVADEYVMGGYDGIGYVLGSDVQGIDLDDCRDPGTGELSELAQEVLERIEGYAEVSPSGTGIKLFSRTNLDGSRTKKEAGVELYREGRYFTVTGHQINGHEALPVVQQDLGWLVQQVFDESLSALPDGDEDQTERALANLRQPLEGWDMDRVRSEIGPYLNLEMHYEEWIRVGQALYHQFDGDDAAFELWDELFRDSPKYGGHEYGWERWRSFNTQRKTGRGPVTLASVLKMTKDKREVAKREERTDLLEQFKQAITDCTDARDLQDQVAARIANTPALSQMERELLAAAIQGRAKDLGVKLPIATCRGWVRSRGGPVAAGGGTPMPEWAKPWVYVTEGDKFFNTETKQEVTSQGFRSMFNRYMPLDQKGNRERADQWAVEMWGMPVVAHKAYMPGAGVTFEMFGRQWVNLYRPESVPAVPQTYSAEDLEAIERVELHLRTYLADERERALLVSWIAWNVQNPGVKIRWAPYVHGVPGDGKSFFSELVAVAMGGQNVRSLNGSTLESNFTDWAVGYALVAIEEMKQHGHNRYDIMNRIKPFITNSQVEIHPKGKASYTAPNVSNYIIFSNYLDGAPVDEGDRRYMFVSSQLTTPEAQRLTQDGYFTRLFDAIHARPGAIRKWLLEYELHQEFDANGRAPDTEVKRTVIEMSKGELELIAEDLIERGVEGVSKTVISSAHLVRAMVSAGVEQPSTTRVNTLLTRLGYRFVLRKKWRGEACRVWLQQGAVMSEDAVVTALNATADGAMDFLE